MIKLVINILIIYNKKQRREKEKRKSKIDNKINLKIKQHKQNLKETKKLIN